MAQISVVNIFSLSKAALLKFGALDWIADAVADAIAKSESVGNRICGLYYLESYCMQLQSGRVKGNVEPIVSKEKSGIVTVDAKFGFAQPAFNRGLGSACKAAFENGICSLVIGHAHTCTSLGYFTEQIAQQNLIVSDLQMPLPLWHHQVVSHASLERIRSHFLFPMERAISQFISISLQPR